MSLILRKECQSILDTFKLAEYHVDINGSNCLSIVTECGKPLVDIFGIKFNRNTPTKEEILYAADLLDAYLGTHTDKINEYLRELVKFNKLVQPEDERFELRWNSTELNYDDAAVEFHMNSEGTVTPVGFVNTSNVDMSKYKFNTKLKADAVKFLNESIKYTAAQAKLNCIQEELASCSI